MSNHGIGHAGWCAISALVFAAATASAQAGQANGQVSPNGSRADSPFATRAALTARANAADSAARLTKDRKVWEDNMAVLTGIRERLENGDFNVGDRIALRVANVPSLTDTFTVRGGRVLELPDIDRK